MKTRTLTMLLFAVAEIVCAQEAAIAPMAAKAPQKSGEVQMRRGGGLVTRMVPGKNFLFADARKDGMADNDKILAEMQMFCEISFVWEKVEISEKSPVKLANELLNRGGVGAVTVVTDGAEAEPVLMAFPEVGIVVLNVTPLKKDASGAVFNDRLEKELWRSVAFAAGGVESMSPHCSLKYIKAPADLDALDCKMLSPEITSHIAHNASKFGFGRNVTTSYRNACREGWAPPPTNDYQKAIWEKVKAAATNAPAATSPAK